MNCMTIYGDGQLGKLKQGKTLQNPCTAWMPGSVRMVEQHELHPVSANSYSIGFEL